MNEIRFVDTTLRDGHQSLWAEGMRTGMMLPVATNIDRAGFEAVELVAPSFFKKCCREFREDTFERIRLMRARMPNTPLRAICNRYMAGFQLSPESIVSYGWNGWRPMALASCAVPIRPTQ
jgi:oxaloacetate decarboxylase alpha subunit